MTALVPPVPSAFASKPLPDFHSANSPPGAASHIGWVLARHLGSQSEVQPPTVAAPVQPANDGFGSQLEAELPRLRRKAVSLCKNVSLADDLVQETALRALRFRSKFREDSNLQAWTHRILHSIFLSWCRRRTVQRLALERFHADPNTWLTPTVRAPFLRALTPSLARAIGELPECYASVLRLVDVGECSYVEAARSLDVPVGTVMSRLHRARRLLRERLARPEAPVSEDVAA